MGSNYFECAKGENKDALLQNYRIDLPVIVRSVIALNYFGVWVSTGYYKKWYFGVWFSFEMKRKTCFCFFLSIWFLICLFFLNYMLDQIYERMNLSLDLTVQHIYAKGRDISKTGAHVQFWLYLLMQNRLQLWKIFLR